MQNEWVSIHSLSELCEDVTAMLREPQVLIDVVVCVCVCVGGGGRVACVCVCVRECVRASARARVCKNQGD